VIGNRFVLSALDVDKLYQVWVAKIKPEQNIEWRIDTTTPPSLADDQHLMSEAVSGTD
jgi:hypothetical protein